MFQDESLPEVGVEAIPRDERSMLVLERLMAALAVAAAILLTLAR